MTTSKDSKDEPSSDSQVLHIVGGKYAFSEGEKFYSYEQLMERMNLHSRESMVYYWRRDTRTVEKAYTKTSRQLSKQLKYYSLRFACIYSSANKQTQKYKEVNVKCMRRARSESGRYENGRRTDCQAHVALKASKCGQHLLVTSVCNVHNHEVSEEVAETLPQTRRLKDDVKQEVIEMLKLKVDRKKIIEYVQRRDNKNITSKNLFNLLARIKSMKLYPPDPEKRALTLQRILRHSKDKGMYTIISNELTRYDLDESTYYQNDSNDLIEYISPEHEFGVNETIIESIVESRERDRQINTVIHSAILPCIENADRIEGPDKSEDSMTKSISENDTSTLILYDDSIDINDDKDEIFVTKRDTDNQSNNFYDQIEDEHPFISFEPKSDPVDSFNPAEGSESSIIVYDGGEDNRSDSEEFHSSQFTEVIASSCGSVVLYETTTDVSIGRELRQDNTEHSPAIKENQGNQVNQENIASKRNIKQMINNVAKRISRCSRCHTNFRLVSAQVNYLRAKRNKLLIQTQLLKMKKKKLIHEMKQLE